MGVHPRELAMEPKNGGLEDDCPLPKGRFSGFILIFGGASLSN